jgi:Cys-tRNA synthase (O-phospho-L-seryl-tRNA:Cys-tRNA synthase)
VTSASPVASANECAPIAEFIVVEPARVITGARTEKFPAVPKSKPSLVQLGEASALLISFGFTERLVSANKRTKTKKRNLCILDCAVMNAMLNDFVAGIPES